MREGGRFFLLEKENGTGDFKGKLEKESGDKKTIRG